MATATSTKGRTRSRLPRGAEDARPLLPVCDTVNGYKATINPVGTISHYERLAGQLWLPPRVEELANGLLRGVKDGRACWASVSGPYGYGKTAAGVTAWRHARDSGYTAIPPLSCSSYDEFAQGVAALAAAQHPESSGKIHKLFRRVWNRGIDDAVKAAAGQYQLPSRKVRKLLEEKVRAGRLSLDGRSHRLVEFLSELGRMATRWSSGLVVVLDELQQLLGPLDTRAITQFREFVWGMRTEQSPCGILVCFDAMLEARLSRWAADLLHRIRESGPSLQLAEVYTRDFPAWLWQSLTREGVSSAPRYCAKLLHPAVLTSLGQFVERADLANGPRTVVDVFSRAINRPPHDAAPYGVDRLVDDLRDGQFRYFGEGAPVQRMLHELLNDDWLRADPDRMTLVRTLTAFPRGCPTDIVLRAVGSPARLSKVKSDLFGALLVDLPDGLALERLQQVRRPTSDWEQVLARCWETLPALDALTAHTPDLIWRVILTRVFPEVPGAASNWERTSADSVTTLTGWRFLRGSFDDAYPRRDIAVWVGCSSPSEWPDDVDVAVALTCSHDPDAMATGSADLTRPVPRVSFTLPLARPLDPHHVPPELERYRKYLDPEPFRGLTVVAAVHDLEAFTGGGEAETPAGSSSFVGVTLSYLISELFQGTVELAPTLKVRQRGTEVIRALLTSACRFRFGRYRTLMSHQHWSDDLASYRKALNHPSVSPSQRHGRAVLAGVKAELLRDLFGRTSSAAADSFLRLLGPLVEVSGSPDSFSLRLSKHPGEVVALDYLAAVGKRRTVPTEAVREALRHAGYLAEEADALVRILADRGLIVVLADGVRLSGRNGVDAARNDQEYASLSGRLRSLGVAVPAAVGRSASEVAQHLDALRQLIAETVASTLR